MKIEQIKRPFILICVICCMTLVGVLPAHAGVTLALGGMAYARSGDTLTFVVTADGPDKFEPLQLVLVSGAQLCSNDPEFTLKAHKTLSCQVPDYQKPGKYDAYVGGGHTDGTPIFSNRVSFVIVPNFPIQTIDVWPRELHFTFISQHRQLEITAAEVHRWVFSLRGMIALRSRNREIATVDENGLVVAVSAGQTTVDITYGFQGSTVVASVPVTVRSEPTASGSDGAKQ